MIHTNSNSINLFFTGYMMPFKRYKSYLPNIAMIPDPVEPIDSNDCQISALTHSVGLVKALIYCLKHGVKFKVILAIDPPDISDSEIIKKLNDQNLPNSLKTIYEEYIYLRRNMTILDSDIPICLYRNIKNKDYMDSINYSSLNYYHSDTHYPYTDRSLRDQILGLYEKLSK